MRAVTSSANPLIKTFRRALAEGVTRDGWLAVEGPLLCDEAIHAREHCGQRRAPASATIRSVLIARGAVAKFAGLLAKLPPGTEISEAPDSLFERVASTVSPQGIAALVELTHPPLERVLRLPEVLLVAVLDLQDPGNLGTILRSAEAFGADAAVTLKPSVRPHNSKTMRASAGAVFRMPVFSSLAPEEFFQACAAGGIRLLAASPHAAQSVADLTFDGSLAFLIGNEAAGLPASTPCAKLVSIPLQPGVDSLNAAVAASVLLYEAARQRGFRYAANEPAKLPAREI